MKLNELTQQTVVDQNSFKKLQTLQLPDKYHEDFRSIKPEFLYEQEFELACPKIVQDLHHHFEEEDFYYLYIINDKSIVHYSDLPQGVQIYTKNKTLITSNNAFYYLSESFLEEEVHLSISKMLDKPLALINIFTQDNTFYPNGLHINIEENLSTDIIDVFLNKSEHSFANINRHYTVKDNSVLRYYKVQDMKNSTLIVNHITHLQEKADLTVTSINDSDAFHINIWENPLNNPNSAFNFYGLVNTYKEAFISNIIKTQHNAAHTSCDIHIRHVLKDRSKASFEVENIVNKEALHAKAFQNCHTILLSDDATIFAKPHLEILTDELQASHGATTGDLNEEHLLYLQSRGIQRHKAKDILLDAFASVIYDKIASPHIKSFMVSLQRGSDV
jgi:Fe-S cluster assembly protein SufD